ncbi:MAG TPA: universal stress protein [Candidatus Binatia bacterium]|nr:universal stress protein [Candidatus Binatia bacterium]
MPVSKTYLVPIDFSKHSELALGHALELARANGGKLLLVHVILNPNVPVPLRRSYEEIVEKGVNLEMEKLVRCYRLKPGEYRVVLLWGSDAAEVVAEQARKSRASMIIMGSHGRTGLQHLILGSVAEKTLRYAHCPVLIVKK